MTLTGITVRPEYMGTYERSEKTAHGAPVFVKKAGTKTHYLFRWTDGTWMGTDDEKDFAVGTCGIESSKPSDLPSEAGLSWKYYDGKAWQNDNPDTTCAEVCKTRH